MEQQRRLLRNVFDPALNYPRRALVAVDKELNCNKTAASVAFKWVSSVFHHGNPEEEMAGDGHGMNIIGDASAGLDFGVIRLSFQRRTAARQFVTHLTKM